MLPYINNGIKQCCVDKTCINNFQGIPVRVFDRKVVPYHQFLFDKDEFCSTCGFPDNTQEIFEKVEDLHVDSANEVSDMGFDAVRLGNSGNCKLIQTFWQRRHRFNSRFGRNRTCRKKHFQYHHLHTNKEVLHVFHQIYRYLPFHTYPDVLMDRILREMMAIMREGLLHDIPDFFFVNA